MRYVKIHDVDAIMRVEAEVPGAIAVKDPADWAEPLVWYETSAIEKDNVEVEF